MLGGRTHVKVEESSGDEEQLEQKRPKKEVVERKGKGKVVVLQAVPLTLTHLWLGRWMRFPMPLMRRVGRL